MTGSHDLQGELVGIFIAVGEGRQIVDGIPLFYLLKAQGADGAGQVFLASPVIPTACALARLSCTAILMMAL